MPENMDFDTKIMKIGALEAEKIADNAYSPAYGRFRQFRGRRNLFLSCTLNIGLTNFLITPA